MASLAPRRALARGFARARLLSTAPAQAAATLRFSTKLLISADGTGTGAPEKPHEKVQLLVQVAELGLTPPELARLMLVTGRRIDRCTGTLKLVESVYETADENKAALRAKLWLLVEDAVANSGVATDAKDSEPSPLVRALRGDGAGATS
mmetsp:Transcript_34147/g.85088  ORF Transcript_34147/g.85088 Transcript_34147/m.85088 type:complete len:150 (+) Transcript_34147:3-452(+)